MAKSRSRRGSSSIRKTRRNKSRGGAAKGGELFDSIIVGDANSVKTMLEKDINLLNTRSEEKLVGDRLIKGMSPMTAACYAGNLEIINIIINHLNLSDKRILELAEEEDSQGATAYDLAMLNIELWPFSEQIRELIADRNEAEFDEHIKQNIIDEMKHNPKLTRNEAVKQVKNSYAEHYNRMANAEYENKRR
jgi:hypothetical protein